MKLWLPYMWSKRAIAKQLVDFILYQNPETKYVYDLFWWWWAISFEFVRRWINTHYNELNTGVTELLKKIRDEWVTKEFYQWIDRDTFHKHKQDHTRFGWLLATCWSFGNNQKDYLYWKNIEELKHEAHNYIMNNWYDGTVETRQKLFREFNKKYNPKTIDKERLSHFTHIESLQYIESIQRIESIQQIGRITSFPTITNLSYDEVEITTPNDTTIIYLDPPYFNTAKYQKTIDHDKLYEWIHKQQCKVYVSSYEYNLPLVWSIEKRVTLSKSNKTKKAIENLYLYNPKEK